MKSSQKKNLAVCVQRLMDTRGLSQRDVQAVYDEVMRRRDSLGTAPDEVEMAKQLTLLAQNDLEMVQRKRANNQRARVLGLMKQKEVGAVIQRFVDSGMDLKEAWFTFLLGGSTWEKGSLNSVAQTRLGLERYYLGRMHQWARRNQPLLKALKRNNERGRELNRQLAKAMHNREYEGGPLNELAKIMAETLEDFRETANDYGLDIGSMRGDGGYIPHRHDRDKLIKKGAREKFVKTVMRTVDLEKTYGLQADYRESILGSYEALIGNQSNFVDGAALLPSRTGASLEKSRELHFLNGEAWEEYAAEFGRGGVFDAVANYLDSGTRQLAVIQRLGPRPEETIGRLIDRLHVNEGDKKTMDFRRENSSFNLKRRDGDIAAMFRTVAGEDLAPDNFQAAKIASLLRSMQSLTKLGGATLSAIADLPVAAMRLKTNHGMSMTQAWCETAANFIHRIPAEVRDEAGYVIDAICEGIHGDMALRFDVDSAMSDKTNRLMSWFFKVNGLTPWTDAMKTGMYMGLAANVGFHQRASLDKLPAGFRETLKMYDLDGNWDLIRSNLVKRIGEKHYLCPELARDLPDDMVDQMTRANWEIVPENAAKEDFAVFAGHNSSRAWNFLPVELKKTLGQAGLGQRWDVMRQHMVATDVDGVKYLVPELARQIPDEAVDRLTKSKWWAAQTATQDVHNPLKTEELAELKTKLREEYRAKLEQDAEAFTGRANPLQEREVLRESLRRQFKRKLEADTAGFLSGEVNRAVLTPDERNRYALRRGTRPGTAAGEGLRFATQFKSFPVLFIQQVLKPIFNSSKVYKPMGMLKNAGLMLAQATIFGFFAMEVKRFARGEKPYIATENADWRAAFMAAFIQGGGAGLYGDFLLGEYNRFGQSALESMAGPVAGTVGDALKLFGKTRASAAGAVGLSDEPGLTGADVFRFAQSNLVPGANTWYAKLALDWAFLWDFQEYLTPGTQARRVRRARKEGREYWLSPTDSRLTPFTD